MFSEKEKKDLFFDFLRENKILIVDKSSASRRRLAKTLVDLGAKMTSISMTNSYDEGIKVINQENPRLVISDYFLKGGSGFDLFRHHRENIQNPPKNVFVLITANLSQASVARAAEEDVDSFILKPYTLKILEKNLINAVVTKLHPSEYMQKIEQGRDLLFAGEAEKARALFVEAAELTPRPSLAYYYQGQVDAFKKNNKEAISKFKDGLSFNHIHYRCQVGLFDLLMKDKRHEDAYEVVKNIAKYFPANPERLSTVIRLAVTTKNYEDIDNYYDIFKDIEERTPELTKYVGAGLFVCGKFFLYQENLTRAINVFRKIVVSCPNETQFVRPIIETLYEFNLGNEIGFFLSRYSPDEKEGDDYRIGKMLFDIAKGQINSEQVVQMSISMLGDGIQNRLVYRELIKAMIKSQYFEKVIPYIESAKEIWPDSDWKFWEEKLEKEKSKAA